MARRSADDGPSRLFWFEWGSRDWRTGAGVLVERAGSGSGSGRARGWWCWRSRGARRRRSWCWGPGPSRLVWFQLGAGGPVCRLACCRSGSIPDWLVMVLVERESETERVVLLATRAWLRAGPDQSQGADRGRCSRLLPGRVSGLTPRACLRARTRAQLRAQTRAWRRAHDRARTGSSPVSLELRARVVRLGKRRLRDNAAELAIAAGGEPERLS
jgi:hypothetical protein